MSGVAIGTVSRAINDHPAVLPATRARVREAALRLGYVPDRAAQSLRTGRTGAVGCVLSFGHHPVASPFTSGIESVLREAGYTTVYGSSVDRRENEAHLLSFFGQNRVDGLITNLAQEGHPDIAAQLRSLRVPVILFERDLDGAFDTVLTDQASAAYEATSHLLLLGHQRIALAVGSRHTHPGRARYTNFLRAYADAGRSVDPALVVNMVSQSDFGLAEALDLLQLPDPPTAVIVGAHEIIGLLEAARHLAWPIPERLSVICFGATPLADLYQPPLTVVRWDAFAQGRIAAEMLLRRLSGDTTDAVTVMIPTELVRRTSCCEPAR